MAPSVLLLRVCVMVTGCRLGNVPRRYGTRDHTRAISETQRPPPLGVFGGSTGCDGSDVFVVRPVETRLSCQSNC